MDFLIFNDTLKSLFITLIIRNPCNKCLVRACCSLLCEEKRHYLTFCDIDGNIKFLRMCAISIILSCISLPFSILYQILR